MFLRARTATAPSGERWIVDPRWVWRHAWKLRWRGKGGGGEALAESGFDTLFWLPDFSSGLDFGDELGLILLVLVLVPLLLAFIFFFLIPLVIFLVELAAWLAATLLFVRIVEVRSDDSGEIFVRQLPLLASPARQAKRIAAEIESGTLKPRTA